MSDIKPIRRSDRVSKKPPPPFEPNDSSSSSNSRRSKVTTTTKTTKTTTTSLKSPKKSTKSQATTTSKTSSVLSKPKTKTTTTAKSSKVDLPASKKATVSSKSSRSSKPPIVPKKTTINNKKKNVEVRSKSLKTITTDVTATKSKNSLEQDEQDLMNSTYDMLQGTRGQGGGRGPRNVLSNQKQSTVDQNSNQIDSIFAKLKQWKSQISEGENRLETMLKAANINLIDEEESNGVCVDGGGIDGGKPYDEDNNTMKQLLSKQIGSLGFDLKYDILCGLIDDHQNILDVEESMKQKDVKVGKQIESSIEKIWTKRYNIFGDNFSENVDVDEDDEDEEEDVEDRIDPIKYRELYLQNVIEPLEIELCDTIFIGDFGDIHRNCNIESKIAKYVKVPFLFYNLYLWKRLWFYRNRQYPTISFESFEQSHRTIREQIDCYYRRLQMETIVDEDEDEEHRDVNDNSLDLDHLFSIFYHYFRKTIDETLSDILSENRNSTIRNKLIDLTSGTTTLIQHLLVLFDVFRKVLLNLIELKHSGGGAAVGGGGSTRDDPISCCIAREFSNRKSFTIKCLLCLFNFLSKINQQQMALLVVVDGDVKHRRQNNNRRQCGIDSEQFNILEQFCETVLTLCGGEEHYSVFQQFFRMLPRIQRGMGFEQKLRQFQLFVRLLPPSTVQCYLPHILGEICKLIIDYDDVDGDGGMKNEEVNGGDGNLEEDITLITNLRDVYPLMGTAFAGKSFLGNSPKKSTASGEGKMVSLSTILYYVVKILYYGFSKYNNFDSRTPKMLDNFLACQRHLSKETKEMILLIKYKVSNELINN